MAANCAGQRPYGCQLYWTKPLRLSTVQDNVIMAALKEWLTLWLFEIFSREDHQHHNTKQ
jgi:hypothetical protein